MGKNYSALKHGGYASAALLPGEDPAAFKKLHDALVIEISPAGALENEIVSSIARLVWRKRHLATFRIGRPKPPGPTSDEARKAYEALMEQPIPREGRSNDPAELREVMDSYYEMIRQPPTPPEQKCFEHGEIATMEQLMSVLAIEERLDSMIDRCLKRLLFLRGLKSLGPVTSVSSPSRQKRLPKSS